MIENLKKLETLASYLEPDSNERLAITRKIIDYSENFLENINTLPSYNFTQDKGIGIYDSPIQEESGNIEELLRSLKKNVDTPGLNPASKGHLGYIPGGGLFHSSLGDYLAAITNRYAGVFFASPGAVRMENMLLEWMCSYSKSHPCKNHSF